MRGSAAENQTPTVTLDFDFCWEVREGLGIRELLLSKQGVALLGSATWTQLL
jgi:hypothetical protein